MTATEVKRVPATLDWTDSGEVIVICDQHQGAWAHALLSSACSRGDEQILAAEKSRHMGNEIDLVSSISFIPVKSSRPAKNSFPLIGRDENISLMSFDRASGHVRDFIEWNSL